MKDGEKLGIGFIYGIFPCWIVHCEASEPEKYGPMLIGGVIAEVLLQCVSGVYAMLVGVVNVFLRNVPIEPMFVIVLTKKTKEKIEKEYGNI